ncbi:NADH dehydrogenase subunit N [Sanguibacter gelidistatuariae]|uniref:NADH-quinone oxidoreductase subunit N n=1 Tax=Sanguibacter gelidistatuariae TaxID=1814289 RepID=A0A1G6WZB7_9MICO|nr:NADH-quinone oxidoreductase subunit NuoN [Sanguibacter gelidistatuariae]SDD70983.1 NADH dehydrogenase subunit N [Sanguibacter gelidistatuariae]
MIAQAAQMAAAPGGFVPPEVAWFALTPLIIVISAGVLGVLVEAFVPANRRRVVQVIMAMAALAAAFAVIVWQGVSWFGEGGSGGVVVLGGVLQLDGVALLFQGLVVLMAFFALAVVIDRTSTKQDAFSPSAASIPGSEYEELARRLGLVQTEVYPLLMFAISGMMIFPAAGDLLTMFIALEVLSLPLYVLSGMARRRRLLSQEASFKYFVLGAFASAVFLFGAALLYGYSGSVKISEITTMASTVVGGGAPDHWELLWLVGILMVISGLLFKVGAVPFQAWTPDVYQGAPTPITGFMAACTKIAAFGALLRLIYAGGFSGTPDMLEAVRIALWVVAIATMIVGTVVGATQTDMKRMLGYSSIAHAGFVLVGILSFNGAGIKAVIFYLLAYGMATVGAFAVITLVRETGPGGEVLGEATHLGQWAGLGKRSPWLAGCFSVFLLSFAGIPLTAGFIAKFSAFSAAVEGTEVLGNATVLAVIGVLASAVAVFFYIRVIVIMFFMSPAETVVESVVETVDVAVLEPVVVGVGQGVANAAHTSVVVATGAPAVVVVRSEGPSAVTITVMAVGILVLGIFPAPVLDLIARMTGIG